MAKKKRNSKGGKYSKFIVFLIILLNTTFTFAVLYVFKETGSEPMALVGAWFSFTTGELWLLSGIKKKKIKEVITSIPQYESDIQDEETYGQ